MQLITDKTKRIDMYTVVINLINLYTQFAECVWNEQENKSESCIKLQQNYKNFYTTEPLHHFSTSLKIIDLIANKECRFESHYKNDPKIECGQIIFDREKSFDDILINYEDNTIFDTNFNNKDEKQSISIDITKSGHIFKEKFQNMKVPESMKNMHQNSYIYEQWPSIELFGGDMSFNLMKPNLYDFDKLEISEICETNMFDMVCKFLLYLVHRDSVNIALDYLRAIRVLCGMVEKDLGLDIKLMSSKPTLSLRYRTFFNLLLFNKAQPLYKIQQQIPPEEHKKEKGNILNYLKCYFQADFHKRVGLTKTLKRPNSDQTNTSHILVDSTMKQPPPKRVNWGDQTEVKPNPSNFSQGITLL